MRRSYCRMQPLFSLRHAETRTIGRDFSVSSLFCSHPSTDLVTEIIIDKPFNRSPSVLIPKLIKQAWNVGLQKSLDTEVRQDLEEIRTSAISLFSITTSNVQSGHTNSLIRSVLMFDQINPNKMNHSFISLNVREPLSVKP